MTERSLVQLISLIALLELDFNTLNMTEAGFLG